MDWFRFLFSSCRLVDELNLFLDRMKYYIITFGSLVLCTGLFQVQQVHFHSIEYRNDKNIARAIKLHLLERFRGIRNGLSTGCSLLLWHCHLIYVLCQRWNNHSFVRHLKWCVQIVLVSIWCEIQVRNLFNDCSCSKTVSLCIIWKYQLFVGNIYNCMKLWISFKMIAIHRFALQWFSIFLLDNPKGWLCFGYATKHLKWLSYIE